MSPAKCSTASACNNLSDNITEIVRLEQFDYYNQKLPTLAYRRLRGDMIEVYKIIHNIYDHESVPHLLKKQ